MHHIQVNDNLKVKLISPKSLMYTMACSAVKYTQNITKKASFRLYCKYRAQCWSVHLCSISTTFHTIKFSRLLLLLRLLDFCSLALVFPPPCSRSFSLVVPFLIGVNCDLRVKSFFYIQLAFMSFHEFQFHWFFIRLRLGMYIYLKLVMVFFALFFLGVWHPNIAVFDAFGMVIFNLTLYQFIRKRICKYSP